MKRAKRKAQRSGKAAYAVITRSLLNESGQFMKQQRGAALLQKCNIAEGGEYCNTAFAPVDSIQLLREYDEALGTLEDFAKFQNDDTLLELVQGYRKELQNAYDDEARKTAIDDLARLSGKLSSTDDDPLFICGDMGNLDVSGLEPNDVRTLRLLLKKWNRGAAQVYSIRGKRRFIKAHCIQLNHPFIEIMPFYDDLQAMYQRGEYEEIRR
jgi:hypothetical protein